LPNSAYAETPTAKQKSQLDYWLFIIRKYLFERGTKLTKIAVV